MVVVAEVDSYGHEVKELQPDVSDMILTAGAGIESAFGAAAQSLSKMSVNSEVVGKDASKVLTEWRADVIHFLVVFTDYLLPLTQRVVNDVEKTLRTYFGPRSTLDEFKQLLPVLKAKLGPRIQMARDTKTKIVLMSSDLLIWSKMMHSELGAVDQLKQAVIATGKNEQKAKKAAKRMNTVGTATSVGTAMGTLAAAKGCVIAGGMISAIPALAPAVLGVGLYVATMSKQQASESAGRYIKKASDFVVIREQISETLAAVENLNIQCRKFAKCLEVLAKFQAYIESQLEQISDPDCEIGDPDHILELLFNQEKDHAREVIRACSAYTSNATKVEIAVQVLDQFKPDDSREFVAGWIRRAEAEVGR